MEVDKAMLEAFLTCPLCTNILKYATAINECLHTFCRDCIYKKLIEEKLNACPVCNVDLGCAPLEKLRLDYTVEQLKLKIYRPKPKTIKPQIDNSKSSHFTGLPEPFPVNSTSKDSKLTHEKEHVPLEPNVPRTQVFNRPVRKSRKGKKKVSKTEKNRKKAEYDSINQSSSKIISNIAQENESALLAHNDKAMSSKGYIQKQNEEFPIISDLLTSLNHLAKPEDETQHSKTNDQETIFVSESQKVFQDGKSSMIIDEEANSDIEEEVYVRKPKKSAENKQSIVVDKGKTKEGARNGEVGSSRVVLRPRRYKKSYKDDSDDAEVISTLQDTDNGVTGRNVPIWFTLIASEYEITEDPLPQISPRYLRVKDRNLPVLYIQKYIAKKLNLASEAEVEIWLRHEPVPSSQRLHNLLDWWVQTTPVSEQISATAGSSAADFVMELFYSRKSHL